MTKPWIAADEVVFVAVGVPEGRREQFGPRALRVLAQYGFAAKEMEPDDIVAQARHIEQVRSAAAALDIPTDRQETDR